MESESSYYKDMLYLKLDYFIRKSDYVLDFCLTEINNAIFSYGQIFNNNLFIFPGSIQIMSGGEKLICPRW